MTLRIFFVRRLQENQRTLAILTLRTEESFPKEFELISDLNELHSNKNNKNNKKWVSWQAKTTGLTGTPSKFP